MKYFLFPVSLVLFGSCYALNAQTFTLPGQVQISVAPGFNHTPLRIPITTNSPGLNLSNMIVKSDSAWVSARVDAATTQIALSFVSSNLINSLYTATVTASLDGVTNSM